MLLELNIFTLLFGKEQHERKNHSRTKENAHSRYDARGHGTCYLSTT